MRLGKAHTANELANQIALIAGLLPLFLPSLLEGSACWHHWFSFFFFTSLMSTLSSLFMQNASYTDLLAKKKKHCIICKIKGPVEEKSLSTKAICYNLLFFKEFVICGSTPNICLFSVEVRMTPMLFTHKYHSNDAQEKKIEARRVMLRPIFFHFIQQLLLAHISLRSWHSYSNSHSVSLPHWMRNRPIREAEERSWTNQSIRRSDIRKRRGRSGRQADRHSCPTIAYNRQAAWSVCVCVLWSPTLSSWAVVNRCKALCLCVCWCVCVCKSPLFQSGPVLLIQNRWAGAVGSSWSCERMHALVWTT